MPGISRWLTSITFERLYDDVEGDSTTSTELCEPLSCLSGYPLQKIWQEPIPSTNAEKPGPFYDKTWRTKF